MRGLRNSNSFGYLHTHFVFHTQDGTQTGQASKLFETLLRSFMSQSLTAPEIPLTKCLNKMENQFKIQEICEGVRGAG